MLNNGEQPFHPLLQEWFGAVFGEPTDVQRQAWASIAAGRHTLIAAPTGSGKTLAALLPCVNAALNEREAAGATKPAGRGVRILYITPLKALNNDIQHHVVEFMEQLEKLAAKTKMSWPGFRSAVRTGDTTPSQRAAMQRKPPELLVTTPESLFILLTSAQGRTMLRTVRHVIVDEIHDLAADKRGAHLSLSLERLERIVPAPVQRIGVSATIKPLERVARFLGGWSESDGAEGEAASHPLDYASRPVHVIESRMSKRMEVRLTMPDLSQPVQSRESVWLPILQTMFALMEGCVSALVFVNSRRLCERLVLRINDHAGYELAGAHHGSMSKEKRLETERRLKAGELRCIVATSSLELGIDVGHIDLVLQIDSPLDAASAIQRIGRAGHGVGDVSRGVIVVRQRGALPESAVLGKMAAGREIDPIRMPERPLDVLSQQAVASIGSEDGGMTVDELYRLALGSDIYRDLSKELLERMLQVLSGYYPFARPLLDWNRASGLLTKRGSTVAAAYTGAGTIPQSSAYPVHHVDTRTHLGELDEEFIHESRVGDVFLLGAHSWMIRRIDKDRVYVSETKNGFSEIPFWRNEGPGRTFELGARVGAFMRELAERLGLDDNDSRSRTRHWSEAGTGALKLIDETRRMSAADWLTTDYGMDGRAADELMALAAAQHAVSELPTDQRIVIEHYRDTANQTHVVLLSPFGRKVHRTWLLALQRQFELTLPYQLYGNAKDNGIEFVLPEWDSSWLQMIWQVTPANLEPLLSEAITGSPLLAIAFRRIAETSLLLSRSFARTPLWQKRLRSEELLREALPFAAEFPYLEEAIRECMNDYLDLERLKRLLASIQSGDIRVTVRETEFPSPLAAQFMADYVSMRIYEGDGLDASTQLALLQVSKEMAGELFGKDAVKRSVSPEALAAEERRLAETKPAATVEDVADLLKRRGDMSSGELVKRGGAEALRCVRLLEEQGRALRIRLGGDADGEEALRWIGSDEAEAYASFPHKPSSVALIAGRFAEQRISFTEPELCERYPFLTLEDARRIVDALLHDGKIRQSPFVSDGERIWSSSKVALRLLRLTVQEARDKAKPLEADRWCGHVAMRQYALHGSRLNGDEGLLAVIGRMQGLFLPLSHWETLVFPARVSDYRKEALDRLCASGEIIWLGQRGESAKEGRIAFFLRSDSKLYAPYVSQAGADAADSTEHPALLELLRRQGASFLTALSRSYGKSPSDTMNDLMALVWEGRASNDQFAPLRLHGSGKGADWARTGSGFGRWYWTGTLAEPDDSPASAASGESKQGVGEEPVVLHRAAEAAGGAAGAKAERYALPWIHLLLERYGIVTKELAAAATPFGWDELLPALNRLEEWGTLTRGVFIGGAMTMQFTTPEIAESLRSGGAGRNAEEPTVLSAADPANPYGLFIDWPAAQGRSFGRKPGSFVVLEDGRWTYWIENNGKKIYRLNEEGVSPAPEEKKGEKRQSSSGRRSKAGVPGDGKAPDPERLKRILGTILRRQGLTKITVNQWNGVPVAESEQAAVLRSIGAERDRLSYVLWMSSLNR